MAHLPLRALRFWVLYLFRFCQVDTAYRWHVYCIQSRSSTVHPRTVWDIHWLDVDAFSIEWG